MTTSEQRELVLKEFTNGITEYFRYNEEVFDEFTQAWYNGDNRTVTSIVDDYLMELGLQP